MVDRAFALLYAFTPADPELSLAELCRRTCIAKPTAHRILAGLSAWGLVERSGDAYRLGMGLFELGTRAPAPLTPREAAAPLLANLAEDTHQTVHPALRAGTQAALTGKP